MSEPMTTDHGAAGFCTDHAKPAARPTTVAEAVEAGARVLCDCARTGRAWCCMPDHHRPPHRPEGGRPTSDLTERAARAIHAQPVTRSDLSMPPLDGAYRIVPSAARRITTAVLEAVGYADLLAEAERLRAGDAIRAAEQQRFSDEADDAEAALDAALAERDAARAALDRAWFEGWTAGCNDQQYGDEDAKPWTPNPYRAALDPEEPAEERWTRAELDAAQERARVLAEELAAQVSNDPEEPR